MTLAEQALAGREFKTVQMPDNFQIVCSLCNGMVRPGDLAKRFDGATYTHETCPNLPLKTFAPHRYNS